MAANQFQTYNKVHLDKKIINATNSSFSKDGDDIKLNLVGSTSSDTILSATVENVAFTEESQTLKNKTMDFDVNTISNIETDNFKSTAISTSIPATGSAVDTKLATEKAVSEKTVMPEFSTSTKVGNLPSGYNLTDKNLVQVLKLMLGEAYSNPGVSLTIKGASSDITSSKNFEKVSGSYFDVTSIDCGYTKGTSTLSTLTLKINGVTKIDSEAILNDPATGTRTYIPSETLTVNSNSTFTLIVTDVEGISSTYNININFYDASYYGVMDSSGNYYNADSTGNELEKHVFTTPSQSLTFTFDDKRIVYKYPTSFGSLTSIKDPSGFEQIDSFTQTTVTEGTVNYRVYTQNTASSGTSFVLKFSA